MTSRLLKPRLCATSMVGSSQNLTSPFAWSAWTCIRRSSREKKKNRKPPALKIVGLMIVCYIGKILMTTRALSLNGAAAQPHPAAAAGRSPGAQRRGVGCRRG